MGNYAFDWNYEKHPQKLQIETTIICQAKCPFCPQHNARRRPSIMPMEMIEKILHETRGLGITYRPFILNEPFADKRMPEIVKMIKEDSTARVEFNSNGELLTPEKAEKILDAGVDVMRFSVDGIRKETFDETRGISYERTYQNVGNFIDQAKKRNHPVKIEVRMIQLPGTEEEQKEYKAYWTEKGVPVRFTQLYRYPWEGQTKAVLKPCLKVLDEMFIYVNGQVTLCCWDSAERAVVGDLNDSKLLDIWNGQMIKLYRDHLARGERDKITLCSRCDAYEKLDFATVKTNPEKNRLLEVQPDA